MKDPRKELRRARLESGLSLSKFGGMIGTDKSLLHNIETGARQLGNLDAAIRIEQHFGIPVESWPRFKAFSRLMELREGATASLRSRRYLYRCPHCGGDLSTRLSARR